MIRYEFDNVEDMKNLESGQTYNTKVVSIEWRKDAYVITLHFLGTNYTPEDPQCLFPVTKE